MEIVNSPLIILPNNSIVYFSSKLLPATLLCNSLLKKSLQYLFDNIEADIFL